MSLVKGKLEKPIERYKSRILLSDEHKESLNAFEKYLSHFMVLKDKIRTLGLGRYTLKLYRISKCTVAHNGHAAN